MHTNSFFTPSTCWIMMIVDTNYLWKIKRIVIIWRYIISCLGLDAHLNVSSPKIFQKKKVLLIQRIIFKLGIVICTTVKNEEDLKSRDSESVYETKWCSHSKRKGMHLYYSSYFWYFTWVSNTVSTILYLYHFPLPLLPCPYSFSNLLLFINHTHTHTHLATHKTSLHFERHRYTSKIFDNTDYAYTWLQDKVTRM